MATNILMPALQPDDDRGHARALAEEGGREVRAGDVIAEIETDKATMEVEAVDEGVLGKILVGDGTAGVKVNEPIAGAGRRGRGGAGWRAGTARQPEQPKPPPAGAEAGAGERARRPRSRPQAGRKRRAAPRRTGRQRPRYGGERIFASPLARRMAKQAGIDLSALKGSGPNGRIVKADIEAAQKGAPPAAPAAAAAPPPAAPSRSAPAAPITAPHTAGPAQRDAESDRAAADRGEADDPALLRLDGCRDSTHCSSCAGS